MHGADTVNPLRQGTKAALHYTLTVPAGGSATMRVRLGGVPHPALDVDPLAATWAAGLAEEFDASLAARRAEADAFYAAVDPVDRDDRRRPRSPGRRSPDCCGASSSTTTTWAAGWPAIRPSRPRRLGVATSATAAGST